MHTNPATVSVVNIDGVDYYPAAEVARVLKVARSTLWRWQKAGKIPLGSRFRDGQLVFSLEEFRAIYAHANKIEPAQLSQDPQLPLFLSETGQLP